MIFNFRDEIRNAGPKWLRRSNALRVMYTIGLHVDLAIDALVAGVKYRFPGVYAPDSLPVISRERRIRRGLYESDATFAERLTHWWELHKTRGNPYAMLGQVHAFFAPHNFEAELVYYSGRRFTLATDGTVTRDEVGGDAPSWPPDAEADKWARWWLFYHVPATVGDDGTWDDPGTWDDGGVWDSGLSAAEVDYLRLIPTEWNAKHTLGRVVLLSPGVTIEDWLSGDPDTAEISIGN